MSPSNDWPPEGEPVLPATVACRLDELGWTADCTTVVEHTPRHALIAYDDKLNAVHHVVVDLRDGHRVAVYGTAQAAADAFAAVKRGGAS